MDVAEVGFAAVARRMIERDDGLTLLKPPMLQVSPDLIVLALVAVLGDEAAVDLRRRVPLRRWGRGSPAPVASTIARNEPSTSAVRGAASVYGLSSGFSGAVLIGATKT